MTIRFEDAIQLIELLEKELVIPLLPRVFQHFVSMDLIECVIGKGIWERGKVMHNVGLVCGVDVKGRKELPLFSIL